MLVEPIFSDYYTPRAGQAFETMEREADRIGYQQTASRKGQVRMARRRVGGGYFTILTPPDGATADERVAYRSPFVHIAVGYPGLKFLPDLQRYREYYRDYTPGRQRLRAARARLRASCSCEPGHGGHPRRRHRRLPRPAAADRRPGPARGPDPDHPRFRTYVTGAHGPNIFMRRRGGDGWAYQGFNYPKSVWGGQLKARMRSLEGEERAALQGDRRHQHARSASCGRPSSSGAGSEGWYRTVTGEVEPMRPGRQRHGRRRS